MPQLLAMLQIQSLNQLQPANNRSWANSHALLHAHTRLHTRTHAHEHSHTKCACAQVSLLGDEIGRAAADRAASQAAIDRLTRQFQEGTSAVIMDQRRAMDAAGVQLAVPAWGLFWCLHGACMVQQGAVGCASRSCVGLQRSGAKVMDCSPQHASTAFRQGARPSHAHPRSSSSPPAPPACLLCQPPPSPTQWPPPFPPPPFQSWCACCNPSARACCHCTSAEHRQAMELAEQRRAAEAAEQAFREDARRRQAHHLAEVAALNREV